MSREVLEQKVSDICQQLYQRRHLITKTVVLDYLKRESDTTQWPEDLITTVVPQCVNAWRLKHMANRFLEQEPVPSTYKDRQLDAAQNFSTDVREEVQTYQEQANQYRVALADAKQTIRQLKLALSKERSDNHVERQQLIKEIKDLLSND